MPTPEPTPEQLETTRQHMHQHQPTDEEIQAAWNAMVEAFAPVIEAIDQITAAIVQLTDTFAQEQAKLDGSLVDGDTSSETTNQP